MIYFQKLSCASSQAWTYVFTFQKVGTEAEAEVLKNDKGLGNRCTSKNIN